ncbi:MAG: hypothetical protein Q4D16_18420 [Eubacteriales bacterium]|nr:hypothetical protein [Eubacteriales bacterium]
MPKKNINNDIDKIAETEDRYAEESFVFSPIDGGCSLVVAKFDGRDTLWTKSLEDNKEIEIKIKLSLSEGTIKVVHIDEDGDVITIIEYTGDNSTDGYVSKKVSLKKGLNRIKIVGYGCRNINLELLSSDFA